MKTMDIETYKNILLKGYEEKKENLYKEIKRIEKVEKRLNEVTIFNASDLGKAVARLVSLMENEEYTFFEFEISKLYALFITLYPDERLTDGYIIKKSSEESTKNQINSLYNSFDIEKNKLLESEEYRKTMVSEKRKLENELVDNFLTKKYNSSNLYIFFSTHLLGENIDVNHRDLWKQLVPISDSSYNLEQDDRFEYINDFINEVVQQRIAKILFNEIQEEKSLQEQAEDYAKSHNNELRLTMK